MRLVLIWNYDLADHTKEERCHTFWFFVETNYKKLVSLEEQFGMRRELKQQMPVVGELVLEGCTSRVKEFRQCPLWIDSLQVLAVSWGTD